MQYAIRHMPQRSIDSNSNFKQRNAAFHSCAAESEMGYSRSRMASRVRSRWALQVVQDSTQMGGTLLGPHVRSLAPPPFLTQPCSWSPTGRLADWISILTYTVHHSQQVCALMEVSIPRCDEQRGLSLIFNLPGQSKSPVAPGSGTESTQSSGSLL